MKAANINKLFLLLLVW